jgi:hypothetical protein
VLVIVTTAVPLHAASANSADARGAASNLAQRPRLSGCNLEQNPFIAWIDPLEPVIVQPILPQLKLKIRKDL